MKASTLRFRHATNRNTKAYEMQVGPHTLFISYEMGYDV